MATETAWFVVVVVGAAAIVLVGSAVLHHRSPQLRSVVTAHGLAVGAVVAALLVLGLLLRWSAFATADVGVVETLAQSRSTGLTQVMSVVTTVGDVVPTLVIASAFAMAWHLSTKEVARPLVLPFIVLVEVGVQFAFGALLHDPTVATLRPDLALGGAGPVPSGSMARLLAVFLAAALLWSERDALTARRIGVTGAV
ncbi:MAG: hypothetical protein M3Y66_08045, partial [Actinomycetota bacterium]|nr:hypothetical protein [Actinomycetota bacterium]